MGKEWDVTGAMAHIKATRRIFHLFPGQQSANLHCLHPSWPSLKGLILNWHCTVRTKWRWQKLTIRHTSFQKWAASPRKKCKMMIIRLCSTIWRTITRYPKVISRRWVRFKHMKKKCARLSTRWWNRRFPKLYRLRLPESANKAAKNRKLITSPQNFEWFIDDWICLFVLARNTFRSFQKWSSKNSRPITMWSIGLTKRWK